MKNIKVEWCKNFIKSAFAKIPFENGGIEISNLEGIKPVTSRVITVVSDGTDYDSLQQPGWYSIYSNKHAPGTGRFLVRVESVSADNHIWYVVQTAYSIYGSIEPSKTRNINQTDLGFGFTPWQ